jgi:ABC-type bacteriocin/lantibiotic exporter with double-glycine peptidase domain
MKIFDKINKIFEKIDENDKKSVNRLFASTFLGAMLNFSLFCIFGLSFTWYSWLGYAFLIHLIEIKLIVWIRQIIFKN